MKTVEPKTWLTELRAYDANKYKIATTLRKLIMEDSPAVEEVKYGGLYYHQSVPYTGIFVYKNHVTLEFSEGVKLKDPKHLLQGSGKHRRNVQFTSPDEINSSAIRTLLKAANKNAQK